MHKSDNGADYQDDDDLQMRQIVDQPIINRRVIEDPNDLSISVV